MKRKIFRTANALLLIPITAICMLSTTVQAQSAPASPRATDMSNSKMQHSNMQDGKMGAHDMKKPMMMGMDDMQKMTMSGNVDKDFAMMMKMHHQQALNMAQMELDHGKSPEMKAMAKQIIAAQKKEIAEFDKWIAKQK